MYAEKITIHIEYRLIYCLTKDIIDASLYDTSLFKYMPVIDVYIIQDEEVNEEEFVPCTVEKYNIHLENYVEECFKDLKGLLLCCQLVSPVNSLKSVSILISLF